MKIDEDGTNRMVFPHILLFVPFANFLVIAA